jgi:type IV pilus assembly protein PilE
MIVVVVAAILSAVAIPAYQEQMRKTYRSAAKQWLVEIANVQAQYLMDARSYGSLAAIGMNTPPGKVGEFYNVTLAANVDCAGSASSPAPGYCLSASPKTDTLQAGDPVLNLDHRGNRLPAEQWD